ncbi:MAG: 2-(1,2-epoxy-1,2-dihydrophenyl) acetyl-CoA isomerase [Chloroflexi bacterium]|nr:MAG: 2-(1,2-epoxy-1,2-dihydrophenyl) acetyl-CoA isomerase [Chloroflexota bacterium]
MEFGNFRGFEVSLRDPGIAWIAMNQPERLNGMTHHLKRDLREALMQAQFDDEVRVVVITGSGRAFSAGDDITGRPINFAEDAKALAGPIASGHHNPMGTYYGLRMISQPLNKAVRELDKMTIASINGVAVQTGLSLALACDFRLGAESARLTSGTLRFGLLPDEGGHKLMVQHMGVTKAIEFCARTQFATAQEALEWGMLNEVVPDADLEERTMALATELANGPQVAMRLLKRTMYNADEMTWDQACDDIATKTALSDWDPDAKEGGVSFKEKRAPVFNKELGVARGLQPWSSGS